MGKKDKRVDDYIAKAEDFAKPIIQHLREVVHSAIPEVEETIKWGFPHFENKGIVCSVASFKQHCAFVFMKASIMADPHGLFSAIGKTAMGQFGQIKSKSDLPNDKILIEYIQEAAKLNQEGKKRPVAVSEKKELVIPGYFEEALKSNEMAGKTFDSFSYSNKKEYLEWVTEAKTEPTRLKRLETTMEWLSEGKIRNWKHVKK